MLELFFQLDAGGEAAGDVDLDEALVARLGEQAVHPGAVEAELLADLRLGEARHEIEPGGAGGELLLRVDGEGDAEGKRASREAVRVSPSSIIAS